MTEAAERLPHARPSIFESEESEVYSQELLAAVGAPYARVVFTSSGSEAVDVALKIAHRYQQATRHPERISVRYLNGHYHGATLGALGVTGLRARRSPYEGLINTGSGAVAGPAVQNIGAMILETIPAAGLGAQVPPPGYLAKIRSLCDEEGALWIADEVLTGFGRVGALFAWQRLDGTTTGSRLDAGPKPDLVVFGKGAGAGFAPVAGVLITDWVAQALDADGFTHFQTYGGNPISAAVGRRVLRAIAEEEINARVREAESTLERALQPLRDIPSVFDVRGLGFLWGIELVEERTTGRPFARELQVAERIAEACRERGVLVHAGTGSADATGRADGERGDFILIAPPLISGQESFKTIANVLTDAISSTQA